MTPNSIPLYCSKAVFGKWSKDKKKQKKNTIKCHKFRQVSSTN